MIEQGELLLPRVKVSVPTSLNIQSLRITSFLDTDNHIYRIPGYQDTRIPGYQDTRIPGYQNTSIPGYQDTRIPGYLDTRIPGYQDTRIPGYLDTRIPGYQDTRILGYQGIGPTYLSKESVSLMWFHVQTKY